MIFYSIDRFVLAATPSSTTLSTTQHEYRCHKLHKGKGVIIGALTRYFYLYFCLQYFVFWGPDPRQKRFFDLKKIEFAAKINLRQIWHKVQGSAAQSMSNIQNTIPVSFKDCLTKNFLVCRIFNSYRYAQICFFCTDSADPVYVDKLEQAFNGRSSHWPVCKNTERLYLEIYRYGIWIR